MIINPYYIPDLGINYNRMIPWNQVRYLCGKHSSYIKENNVYYSHLRHETGVRILHTFIDSETLQGIKNRNIYLMIEFVEVRYEILDIIYSDLVDGLKIPTEQIILVTSSPDFKTPILNYAQLHGVKPIKLEVFNLWEHVVKGMSTVDTIGSFDSVKDPKKVYINLNHFFRAHRAYLMVNLKKRNLLEFGYNSFHNAVDTEEIAKYKDMYPSLPLPETLYLDIKDDKTGISGDLSRRAVTYKIDTLPFYINNSMVHLIGETQFFNGPRDLSEKTFKPILFKQPFLFIGQYKALELLRTLGYKTFSPYIDENYDTIENNQDRLDAIVNEIERLCSMDYNSRLKFVDECKAITEYNHQLLLSKKIFSYIVI